MSGTVRQAARRASPRRRWLTTAGAAVVPAVVATLAIIYPGAPVSEVDLNDGAVWLTNTSQLKVGRYNAQIAELNAGLVVTAPELDVLQDEGSVLLTEPGKVSVVDPAGVALGAQAAVPFGADVSMAEEAVAVTAGGSLWTRSLAALGSLNVETDDPEIELGAGGAAVVAPTGTVLAVAADGTLHRVHVGDEESSVAPDGRLAGDLGGGFADVTAVGETLVALAGTRVHTRQGSVDLAAYGSDLVLQQPGPRADVVLVATPSALLEVPLDGGEVTEHGTGGSGRPAAPVRVGACGHGAWASATGSYLQLCRDSDPAVTDLEQMSSADQLVFRVNRDVVVLNDTVDGRLWLPLEDPELREPNWDDIEREEETDQSDQEADSQESTQNLQAECTEQSSAPSAVDDDYGVRPGRTMILSVIDNDASSDCGILAVSQFDPIPAEFGTLVPIHGGRAFQLTTDPAAAGVVGFTYTIDDGRGASAPSTATVRLTVRGEGDNAAPEQHRVGSAQVEQGASVTYDVLPDFRDPDGDQLVLAGAVTEAGGTVRTRQDGELTFRSDGGALGRKTVRVLVSDGVETIEGILMVDVRPSGSVAPKIDPVHAETYVDQAVVVDPIAMVRSTGREPVRLAGVDEVPGATLVTDLADGSFTFRAPNAGTYYVTFLVTAGPQEARGVARIDVRERPEEAPPPVAVLDRALLPPGGEVTIDPLANDHDPAGGTLVVQSVDVPAETGLRIAVLDHRLLRIDSTRVLDGAVTATYTISNGIATAVGEVLVQPVPASANQQAPVVPNARASVRTGGVVTIPVLEGAYDPDGDPLTLEPVLAEPLDGGEGLMFVSGDVLRYRAPATPVEVHATFTVTDPAGNETAATVTVSVHASDPERKAPPRPKDLTARVFAEEVVRIDVPLTGIDHDGDGVYLLGADRAPAKGRIVDMGADWIEYEALPGELGTDTFTYAVEDWVGQRAVGTIRVGIAERPTGSADVVSRNDDVTVRPGQTVEVRVLANDVDAGGGELELADDLVVLPEDVVARVEGRRVVVEAPGQPGIVQISYTARNQRGGQDSAVLTVTVLADAPILPPSAKDVVVPATETINRTDVAVDVLALAQNPSGPLADLAVSVHPSAADVATATADGSVLVTLVETAQTLPYVLTNTNPQADGVSAFAFITVPALGDFPPIPRPGAPELVVVAGESLRIPLDEQVQVAPGRTPRIIDASTVTATKADGTPLLVDDRTLTYTAQRSYAGPASISFEVSDGTFRDSSTRSRVMTLAITVLAAEDHPPTFLPSVLDVGPGESTRVDLRAFTSAPVGTEAGTEGYTYRTTTDPGLGFVANLEGTVLTVSAARTAPKGTIGGVGIEIGYGVDGVVAGQVDFRVVASSRPLARLVDHLVPDGVEGGASTISVLSGAFNPFPESPLTVVDAVVETPGAGTAGVSGGQVTVRPAAGFIGQMVTRYQVRDVTGDPDREVEGRVTVAVRGRPAQPSAPRVVEVRDRTVVLAWDAPANHGEPITGYRLTSQPGGVVIDCASTTCSVGNLTNNVEYAFIVMAKNAVGWSDPSPVSVPARPDAKPFAPAAPTVSWGDAAVTAAWTAPQNPGSPITRYDVEITPAPPGGSPTVSTASTSHTFTGLVNGTAYTVRVRAINLAPDPGDWSAPSGAQVPAAPPAPPVNATATNSQVSWSGAQEITVRWEPGAANGDPVSEIDVTVDGATTTLGGTARSFTFPAERGRPYPVCITARNKAGTSACAFATGEVWTPPSAPRDLSAAQPAGEAGFGNGSVVLSWSPPADTGGDSIGIRGYVVEGPNLGTVEERGTSRTVGGLSAGQSYTYRVCAVNTRGAVGECVVFPSFTPTTAPQEPRPGSIELDPEEYPETFTASWQAPGQDGGLPVRYEYRSRSISGVDHGWSGWTGTGDNSTGPIEIHHLVRIHGGSVQVEVRAVNDRGGSGSVRIARDVDEPPPEPDPTAGPTP